MAKFSKKVMGKEVGNASVYATPHTMSGKEITTAKDAVTKKGNGIDSINMSVGKYTKDADPKENKYGEQTMRGYGAATKGIKTRGPMA